MKEKLHLQILIAATHQLKQGRKDSKQQFISSVITKITKGEDIQSDFTTVTFVYVFWRHSHYACSLCPRTDKVDQAGLTTIPGYNIALVVLELTT